MNRQLSQSDFDLCVENIQHLSKEVLQCLKGVTRTSLRVIYEQSYLHHDNSVLVYVPYPFRWIVLGNKRGVFAVNTGPGDFRVGVFDAIDRIFYTGHGSMMERQEEENASAQEFLTYTYTTSPSVHKCGLNGEMTFPIIPVFYPSQFCSLEMGFKMWMLKAASNEEGECVDMNSFLRDSIFSDGRWHDDSMNRGRVPMMVLRAIPVKL